MTPPDGPPTDVATVVLPARRPPWLLIYGAAAVAALVALIHLVSRAQGGALAADRALMLAMRVPGDPATPAGGAKLAGAVRDVTALGSTTVLTTVVTLVATFLILKRAWRAAALIVAATVSGSVAISTAKWVFARHRPDLVDHLVHETSMSFPSGHAGNSAVVYLTLASLIFPLVRERRLRAFVLAAAMILVGAIGVSRVYLGVHWPSDVAAGWLFGSLWALGWWWVEARALARPTAAPRPARP